MITQIPYTAILHNFRTTSEDAVRKSCKCTKCGITGTILSTSDYVEIENQEDLLNVCDKSNTSTTRIKITLCKLHNDVMFANTAPDSEHFVIAPLQEENRVPIPNDHTGLWIMGTAMPVRILTGEYTPL